MFRRRATAMDETADRLKQKIGALIQTQDGSEIAGVGLKETHAQFDATCNKALVLKMMAEAYERETGEARISVSGDRTARRAMETGAVFVAKRLLEAADRAEAERNTVVGTFVAVAGSSDWTCAAPIWNRLDAARERCPDMVLCHKGWRGAERIAAASAEARHVLRVLFRPNWNAFRKAAPFGANDEIVHRHQLARSVLVPPHHGASARGKMAGSGPRLPRRSWTGSTLNSGRIASCGTAAA